MGRGIVEPVDDVRISNPASNPELLEALSKKIIEYNYDLKKSVGPTSSRLQMPSRSLRPNVVRK